MERAREYGRKVRTAHKKLDTRTATHHWREYVCWYQALLDTDRLTKEEIDSIQAAYKEGERGNPFEDG